MNEESAALNMRQKFIPETDPIRSAFDQSGDIRHHEAASIRQINHAKDRLQCGEMIVRDFRLRIAYHGQQR